MPAFGAPVAVDPRGLPALAITRACSYGTFSDTQTFGRSTLSGVGSPQFALRYNRMLLFNMSHSPELLARAAKIKLLLMDCDGVMTDGRIFFVPMPDGSVSETKCFDCHDGISISWAHRYNIDTGIITGRGGFAVRERVRSAKMKYLYEGRTDKLPLIEEIVRDSGHPYEEIAFIGDDIQDMPILRRVGLSAAPSNARPTVLEAVHYQIPTVGGSGAVRAVVELILEAQGHWDEVQASYDI